jgi:hypothetical protein
MSKKQSASLKLVSPAPPASKARPKLFNFRLNDDEWDRLTLVAKYHGLNRASVIRYLLIVAERNTLSPGPRG